MMRDLLIYSINAFMPLFYVFFSPSLPFTLICFFFLCEFNPLTLPERYKENNHIQHLLLEDTSAHCTHILELHNMTQSGSRDMRRHINSHQWRNSNEFLTNISLPRTAFLALTSVCCCLMGSRGAMPTAWLKISCHRQREWRRIGARAAVQPWSWMSLRSSSMGNAL